ncbi:phage head-tail connector protein [Pseudobacteroides cellulosolvens]|uniref:Bacteriophage QLRG family DNA packaging n=1 Tax=Pseudobacteroides cellulosolvens ATCC 35603 = DSM 2933 TaxID=398512 RepID=A0A0L6JKL8_9FIRM|nr:phage head-tail connector protein [Pseudobacteroides cellulosolvens]KNY26329.1 Bacteriophage QLRG family DNA packaging [Pseudobacteroides cellulosolvens ATCC 35603 = DSM 2933]
MTNSEILSTAKLLLDISDTSQDAIINYYISALQRRIVNICGLSSFPTELSDLVVDIIVRKIKDDRLDGLDSVNMGDTNIKIKGSKDSKNIIGYLEENMSELQNFQYTEVI